MSPRGNADLLDRLVDARYEVFPGDRHFGRKCPSTLVDTRDWGTNPWFERYAAGVPELHIPPPRCGRKYLADPIVLAQHCEMTEDQFRRYLMTPRGDTRKGAPLIAAGGLLWLQVFRPADLTDYLMSQFKRPITDEERFWARAKVNNAPRITGWRTSARTVADLLVEMLCHSGIPAMTIARVAYRMVHADAISTYPPEIGDELCDRNEELNRMRIITAEMNLIQLPYYQ